MYTCACTLLAHADKQPHKCIFLYKASLTVSPQCEVGKGEVIGVPTEQDHPVEAGLHLNDGKVRSSADARIQLHTGDLEAMAVNGHRCQVFCGPALSCNRPGSCLGAVIEEHFTIDLRQPTIIFCASIANNDTARWRRGDLQLRPCS